MALIKCPECGHEISDQAMRCIHCGKELFHCPDCGKITVRHGDSCPCCGYVQPAAPQPAPISAPAAKPRPASETNLLKAWETACPAAAKRRKALWAADFVLKLVVLGLPVILFTLHSFGVLYPVTEQMLLGEIIDCRDFINDTLTASIVLDCVAGVVFFFIQYWRVTPIANWLKQGKFDVAGNFKAENTRSAKDREGDWAVYCAYSSKGKIAWGLYCFSNSIAVIACIFVNVVIRDSEMARLDSVIMGIDFAFPWEPFVLAAVGIIVVGLITVPIWLSSWHFCKNFLKSYAPKGEQHS